MPHITQGSLAGLVSDYQQGHLEVDIFAELLIDYTNAPGLAKIAEKNHVLTALRTLKDHDRKQAIISEIKKQLFYPKDYSFEDALFRLEPYTRNSLHSSSQHSKNDNGFSTLVLQPPLAKRLANIAFLQKSTAHQSQYAIIAQANSIAVCYVHNTDPTLAKNIAMAAGEKLVQLANAALHINELQFHTSMLFQSAMETALSICKDATVSGFIARIFPENDTHHRLYYAGNGPCDLLLFSDNNTKAHIERLIEGREYFSNDNGFMPLSLNSTMNGGLQVGIGQVTDHDKLLVLLPNTFQEYITELVFVDESSKLHSQGNRTFPVAFTQEELNDIREKKIVYQFHNYNLDQLSLTLSQSLLPMNQQISILAQMTDIHVHAKNLTLLENLEAAVTAFSDQMPEAMARPLSEFLTWLNHHDYQYSLTKNQIKYLLYRTHHRIYDDKTLPLSTLKNITIHSLSGLSQQGGLLRACELAESETKALTQAYPLELQHYLNEEKRNRLRTTLNNEKVVDNLSRILESNNPTSSTIELLHRKASQAAKDNYQAQYTSWIDALNELKKLHSKPELQVERIEHLLLSIINGENLTFTVELKKRSIDILRTIVEKIYKIYQNKKYHHSVWASAALIARNHQQNEILETFILLSQAEGCLAGTLLKLKMLLQINKNAVNQPMFIKHLEYFQEQIQTLKESSQTEVAQFYETIFNYYLNPSPVTRQQCLQLLAMPSHQQYAEASLIHSEMLLNQDTYTQQDFNLMVLNLQQSVNNHYWLSLHCLLRLFNNPRYHELLKDISLHISATPHSQLDWAIWLFHKAANFYIPSTLLQDCKNLLRTTVAQYKEFLLGTPLKASLESFKYCSIDGYIAFYLQQQNIYFLSAEYAISAISQYDPVGWALLMQMKASLTGTLDNRYLLKVLHAPYEDSPHLHWVMGLFNDLIHPNKGHAFHYFNLAASRSHPLAQLSMAYQCANESSPKYNLTQALNFATLAAKADLDEAKAFIATHHPQNTEDPLPPMSLLLAMSSTRTQPGERQESQEEIDIFNSEIRNIKFN